MHHPTAPTHLMCTAMPCFRVVHSCTDTSI